MCTEKWYAVTESGTDVVGTNETIETIDELNTNLASLIDDLSGAGVVTGDDATEFRYRADMLAAELTACVEHADTGPLGGD
ncbi:hypothetical protein ACFPYI_18195 [Halomarina salina]|uniref:Uncharacterized protein n=1 Tax=Halomarina salina TaxID=1872699 RepID=A0ABD5RRN0_9EURY|nr:hypothetical protein [Halomarina salina]